MAAPGLGGFDREVAAHRGWTGLIAATAAVGFGGDHHHLVGGVGDQRLDEHVDSLGAHAVVVGDQNPQGGLVRAGRSVPTPGQAECESEGRG